MPRVTTKVLREQLRQLMVDDIVAREELTPRRPGVRYQVTGHGRTLGRVFETLWRWGTQHLARTGGRRGTAVTAPA
jgi:DNA-binding HxlR family transcriptional regulator